MDQDYFLLLKQISKKISECFDIEKLKFLKKKEISKIVDNSLWNKQKTYFDDLPKDMINEISVQCKPKHIFLVKQTTYYTRNFEDFEETELIGFFLNKNDAKLRIGEKFRKVKYIEDTDDYVNISINEGLGIEIFKVEMSAILEDISIN